MNKFNVQSLEAVSKTGNERLAGLFGQGSVAPQSQIRLDMFLRRALPCPKIPRNPPISYF